jgi:hypothetical protein
MMIVFFNCCPYFYFLFLFISVVVPFRNVQLPDGEKKYNQCGICVFTFLFCQVIYMLHFSLHYSCTLLKICNHLIEKSPTRVLYVFSIYFMFFI